jgi:NADPH:quinone reductase
MRAVVCRKFGDPDTDGVLEVAEVDDPAVGPDQVLIDVEVCAVNFPDLLMIQDLYQVKPDLPFIPGSEVAGTVVEVGPDVEGIKAGDRVTGRADTGGLAERMALSAATLTPVPDGIPMSDAAGLFYAYGTSHYALRNRASMRPGETLVVLGAAGAVGLAATEIGKLMGARVIAAASSETKLALCREYGADETIDYSREDLKLRIRELTDGKGADVVYDPVGGPYTEQALRSTAWNGRYLVVGFASGEIPRVPLNLPLLRGCQIVGVWRGPFSSNDPDGYRLEVEELAGWWRSGQLRPHVSQSYPLEQAAGAFGDLASRKAMGKVVVNTRS